MDTKPEVGRTYRLDDDLTEESFRGCLVIVRQVYAQYVMFDLVDQENPPAHRPTRGLTGSFEQLIPVFREVPAFTSITEAEAWLDGEGGI